jgi:predicted PurR-regulated permease PerM
MRFDLAALVVFALLLTGLSWMVTAPFWAYIVLGLVLATITYPFFDRVRERTGTPRLAAAVTIAGTTLLVLAPLTFLAWRIVADVQSLAANLTTADVAGALHALLSWSHETVGYPASVDPGAGRALLERLVPEVKARASGWALEAITSTASMLLGLTLTAIVTYYALIDGPAFVERLKAASPMDDELEHAFLVEAKGTVEGVVMGQLATAFLQGGLGFLAFVAVGIPNPFFWGFVMAILSFVPVLGAFLIWFPAAIYLFAVGDTALGLGLVLWGVAVISTVDNVVKPVVIGQRGQVHNLLAFVGVLGGLAAFGFLGFVIGPLVLSLGATVFEVLAKTNWRRVEQGVGSPVPAAEAIDAGPQPDTQEATGAPGQPGG